MSNVNYQIRPAKHVERKIFVEVLTHLREVGCDISNYHYIGMGAPYFMDFILFRKHLYIKKMICFESDTGIIGRVKFNRPYTSINIFEGDINSSLISHIEQNQKYLIWLDYECGLDENILSTISSLLGILPKGSIFIATVNSHLSSLAFEDIRKLEVQRYHDLFSGYIPGIKTDDITPTSLPRQLGMAFRSAIEKSLAVRSSEDFIQLFNYTYSDNATMFTYGGIITDINPDIKEKILKINFVNPEVEPKDIFVPTLTHKERLWLDGHDTKSTPTKTGLTRDQIKKYFEIAEHYPTYSEIAL